MAAGAARGPLGCGQDHNPWEQRGAMWVELLLHACLKTLHAHAPHVHWAFTENMSGEGDNTGCASGTKARLGTWG